jgi:DMSO/TMAO reductase YedYZ molybdopterin-dependent catalytic subunit
VTRTHDAAIGLLPTTPVQRQPGRIRTAGSAAAAGLLAAATTLGVAQLVALWTGPATSPVLTVGAAAIDGAPTWLKTFAVATFGDADKLVLVTGILGALAVAAAGIGLLAAWRLGAGLVGVAAIGALGAASALVRPGASTLDTIPAVAGAIAGAVALSALVRALPGRPHIVSGASSASVGSSDPGAPTRSRRSFLGNAVAVAALATTSGGLGLSLGRTSAAPSTDVPTPDVPASPVPGGAELGIAGLSPFVTPNGAFYRVDTALVVPEIDVDAWRLRIHGLVERELTLTYRDLLDLPMVERDITLACVSNPVGGQYAGNARWIGTPLKGLLEEVGIKPGADQLVSRSVDGMSIGTPTSIVMDGRDALLAVAMNGEPLPRAHGYPVRMIVPGLYGFVSATKWLTELELATFDSFDPYWVERGWAVEAPIKTMSRIDTPRPFAQLPAGTVKVAGVAWAPHRGIERVDVRVDDGPWIPARLAAVDTVDTWRQWVVDWAATPGRHDLSVRATDGSDELQTEARADPFPSGATGWHTVVMTVV